MSQTVLYIEDDEDNIFLVESLLRRRPQIELHVAMNGSSSPAEPLSLVAKPFSVRQFMGIIDRYLA